jgi:uncharacterized Fe-S cluster-containing radical SAM superfamily enzyme
MPVALPFSWSLMVTGADLRCFRGPNDFSLVRYLNEIDILMDAELNVVIEDVLVQNTNTDHPETWIMGGRNPTLGIPAV